MITRQHAAITLMAHSSKGTIQSFRKEIPWVLLPDGIRAYSGPRQISHFEQLPDGTDTAWIVFPNELTLRNLSKDSFEEKVCCYMPDGYPDCAIGEATDLGMFDVKNYGNRHYHALRMHMVQDIVLDNVLRDRLVEVSGRFRNEFTVRWNHKKIDGNTLRKQVEIFENLGFIHLAGKVYERTGKVLNNKWFEEYVLEPLRAAYPEDLAQNTFKYMHLSDKDDARITALQFELTEADKEAFFLCDNLQEVLDEMYAEAYYHTAHEM